MYQIGQWIYGIKINEEDIDESELCGYLYMGECGDYIICVREDGDYIEDFDSQLLKMYRECCENYDGTNVHLLKKVLVFEEYEKALEKLHNLS